MDFDQSIIDEFVEEAREHLETVEDDLMELEHQGENADAELINRVFRAVHTVKGAAGFLGLTNLSALAHSGETLLSLMRSGEIKPGPKNVDVLLKTVDAIRVMLDDASNSNEMDISALLAKLEELLGGGVSEETQHEIASDVPLADDTGQFRDFKISEFDLKEILRNFDNLFVLALNMTSLSKEGRDPVALIRELQDLGEIVEAKIHAPMDDLRKGLPESPLINDVLFASKLNKNDLQRMVAIDDASITHVEPGKTANTNGGEEITMTGNQGKEQTAPEQIPAQAGQIDPEPVLADTEAPPPFEGEDRRKDRTKDGFDGSERRRETIRLKLGILDELMRLAGELVLVRNQQVLSIDKADPIARNNAQRLDIVTTELQETIMATRMQPIGNLFNRFTRIVRDLGKKLNKQIDITITGSEVELDNTILEALADPMTHLVRNSCDHGIELPEARQAAGKQSAGHVILRAYHESGQINIEIKDDGKGINPEVLKRKALEKGLKTSSELETMSDNELVSLILLPGFSTHDVATDVSGRGVGMDVVKTSIEQLGGTLDIESAVGKGSTIYMRLPLTLAIIPCLIVVVGDHRYAIPQVNLEELVCLYDEDVVTKVECAGNKEVYRLREHLLPLVRLSELLKRSEPFTSETQSQITENYRRQQKNDYDEYLKSKENGNEVSLNKSLNFAVLKVGMNRFGLIVDEVLGTEEIVVKPMHPAMKNLRSYAGATVMGDGKVALILDVQGIARHSGIAFDSAKEEITREERSTTAEFQTALLFASGEKEQFALPLPLIRRIESIPMSSVESVGDKEYVTIEGVSTLVVRLDKHLNVSECIENEEMHLILPKHIKNPFGILASKLVDTTETSVNLNVESYQEDGLLGTSIVQDKMTLFLDIHSLITKAAPEWFDKSHEHSVFAEGTVKLLLVEDTPFYRQLVKGYLESEGFVVITAENGQQGLDRLAEQDFDLVVSDIEMPVMDGFTFMEELRKGDVQQDIPAIALTALSGEKDIQKVKDVGFDKYETKLDKESLIKSITEVLSVRSE